MSTATDTAEVPETPSRIAPAIALVCILYPLVLKDPGHPQTASAALIGLSMAVLVVLALAVICRLATNATTWVRVSQLVGYVPPSNLWLRERGRPIYWGVVVLGGVAGGWVIYELAMHVALELFPPVYNPNDNRGAGMDAHRPVQDWVQQLAHAGIPEEFLFRAPILGAILTSRGWPHQRWRAAFVAGVTAVLSVLFVLTHLGLGAASLAVPVVITAVNIPLLFATRTVWAGIIAHTTYNTLIYLPI